jgi:hypothetical protein
MENDLRVFKGGRWFIKHDGTTTYTYGFKNKRDALEWVQAHPALDQQLGSTFYLRGVNTGYYLVNRKGVGMRV